MFDTNFIFTADEPTEYWILDTDYESYSLVYTCVNLNSDQRRGED